MKSLTKRPKVTDVEAYIAWLQVPKDERPPLPAKLKEQADRWNTADALMREHLSRRKVIPMLQERYGYSARSAERDIAAGQRVWRSRPEQDKAYIAETLSDYLMECMVRAGKDRRFGDVARLAREIRETLGLNKPQQEQVQSPTTIVVQPVYDPQLLGVQPMAPSSLEELTKRMLDEKRRQGFVEHSTIIELSEADER